MNFLVSLKVRNFLTDGRLVASQKALAPWREGISFSHMQEWKIVEM
jgi:hypothetical protein